MFFKKNFNLIKKNNVDINWYIIDASGIVLGRLASFISYIIQGKNKTEYSRNLNLGDFVIIINASKIIFTGKKLEKKIYYKHTGYIGGLKKIYLKNMLKKNFNYVLIKAVKGMLPKNKLSNLIIKKLKIYKYNDHKHKSQNPKILKI